jgi:hypothetical protein
LTGVLEERRADVRRAQAINVTAPFARWNDVINRLRDLDVEAFLRSNEKQLASDADLAGIDLRAWETQVRLHLPVFTRGDVVHAAAAVYAKIRDRVLVRAGAIGEARECADRRSYASLVTGNEIVRRDGALCDARGRVLHRLEFREVPPRVGEVFQAKLHYLRSPRADTFLELGHFLPGAEFPITYVAFSPCDRHYIEDALCAVGLRVQGGEIVCLTRMHGVSPLPPNLISLTICHAMRQLRSLRAWRYVVTAVNPTLGFTGQAFVGAGFHPFAVSPVLYMYDARGQYVTRRLAGSNATEGEFDALPNLLLCRALGKAAHHAVAAIREVARAGGGEGLDWSASEGVGRVVADRPTWDGQLTEFRQLLESAWSVDTVHPGYIPRLGHGPSSRGQCGVSSVWLAIELGRRYGWQPTYCYGDLYFDDPSIAAVHHHCWLEAGGDDSPDRVIIDITADQAAGFAGRVISGRVGELRARGIHYVARSRLATGQLPADRVWPRYLALRERLWIRTVR